MAPKGKYLEEARFGLAESLYGTKEYEEAILTYQKLIKSYPKSKHIPEALYKQALSFLNLKDTGQCPAASGKNYQGLSKIRAGQESPEQIENPLKRPLTSARYEE